MATSHDVRQSAATRCQELPDAQDSATHGEASGLYIDISFDSDIVLDPHSHPSELFLLYKSFASIYNHYDENRLP